jgi:hypothetical protein
MAKGLLTKGPGIVRNIVTRRNSISFSLVPCN